MKKLFVLLIVLMFSAVVFSADADLYDNGTIYKYTENVPTSGEDVIVLYEDYSHVIYKWRFTFVDSSDNYHSKPLYIGNCNLTDGYVNAVQSTTGDANVIYHYSIDRVNWLTTTAADLDAVSNTAKQDTIGLEEGVNDIKFHFARWLVIEAASGSSTNADDNVFTIIIKLNKFLTNAVHDNGDYIRQGDIARGSTTNP